MLWPARLKPGRKPDFFERNTKRAPRRPHVSKFALYSAASAGGSGLPTFGVEFNSTLSPSERISFTRTLKLSGMPDSKVSSPRTIDS
jgi:hypothetical protein